MSGQRSLFGGGAASAGTLVESAAPSGSSPRRAAKRGAVGKEGARDVESVAPSMSSPRVGAESVGRAVVGRGGEQGADVGPGLPPGWRRVRACLYLPGGLTVARRTAYDGRWQALRWEGGAAELVCERASEEAVLAELARRGLA